MTSFPPALIFILGAALLLVIPRSWRSPVFLAFPLLVFGLLLGLEPGTTLTVPFMDYQLVVLRVDRLSLAFGYVFTLITMLGGVFSLHLRDRVQQVAALLYAGSALGVVFTGDLFTLFVFWEIMAISSVWLIWARRTVSSRQAGMRYLMVHLFGGSVLLVGILMHVAQTGSLLFDSFDGGPAAYLILFGFALNAAIPPLHAWLSDAYPEGTVTGTVFLSAFTTKTAVYVLARGFPGWDILIWAGVAMALYGAVYAIMENDIRRLLAFSIISQIGYMVAAIGLGTETAINGATAHAFTHILYKGLLFMGVGVVLQTTGRTKLTELGGLARLMPLTLMLYMIGAFSISGFPLFSGFVSKSMVIYAAEKEHLAMLVLALNMASVGTFLHTGLKLPYFTWFGPSRDIRPAPAPRNMHVAMALTATASVAIGVYPALLYNILPFPVAYQPYTAPHLLEAAQLLAFTGLAFWMLAGMLAGKPTISLDTDWFYRRPSQLAYRLAVVSVNQLFAGVERLTLAFVRFLIRVSANPVGYLVALASARRSAGGDAQCGTEPGIYDPDRYRLPIGGGVVLVLVFFVVLLTWMHPPW